MKHVKAKSFDVDRNLGYMIQQITGDSTQEILGYFLGVAQFVMEDIGKKSKATWLTKDIVLFYKETSIVFRLTIAGSGPGSSTNASKSTIEVNVNVAFPKTTERHNVTKLMDAVVESGLGLADDTNMPLFERPNLKTPRCLREVP